MIVIRNYHKNSWKLHDCHKLTASLENETIVCFWMGRMRLMGHIGRMVMGQGDYVERTADPRIAHHAPRTAPQAHPRERGYSLKLRNIRQAKDLNYIEGAQKGFGSLCR